MLTRNEVAVFLLPLPLDDADAASAYAVLTPEERRQAESYRVERGRTNFVARRGALRLLIGAHLGEDPGAIRFVRARHGKPRLHAGCRLRFNVSDTDGMAAVAVSRGREVGVDVEALKQRRLRQLAAATFTADELATFMHAPEAGRQGAFYEQWTAKEAYAKAVGLGLRLPFARTQVGALDSAPVRLAAGRGRWAGARIDAGSGHRAAVVAAGGGWRPVVRTIRSVAELAALQ